MATEKILNTRIALKIDTLEHWNSSTLGLKKGELAIATVAATAGTGLTEPVCMIKIGEDGVKTFNDLPWNFYAKASDVLSACKSEASLKSFVNGVIADAGIASNDAMEELAGRVTKLEGNENTEGSVAKAIKDAIDALNLDTTYVKVEDISAERTKLAGISAGANKVEASTTNGNIKIDGVETVVYTHPEKHAIDDVTGLQDAIDDAKKAGTDAAGALDTYKGEMTIALAGKQDTIPENTYDAHGSAAKALEDAKKYTDNEIAKIPAQIDYTVTCTDADHEAAEGVPAFKRHTLTQNGNTICTIDIPKELVVEAGSVEEVTEEGKPYEGAKIGDKYIELVIANQTEHIYVPAKDLVDIYTAKELTTESTDEVKIAISNTNEISATLVDGKIAKGKLASDVQASLGLADSAVQEEDLGTMAKEVATDYVKKSEAVGYGDILTKTEAQGAYQAKGEYYTKTEADAEFTNATEVDGQIDAKITALNLANTYQAKGEYATAEQGGKADTAIQSISTPGDADGEPNGLKAVKTGTDVAITIDDSITWIFDCGNASV